MMTNQRESGVGGYAFGSARPIGASRAEILPGGRAADVHADVPPGVHQQSFSQDMGPAAQAMAPFVGSHMMPTGQNISVNMNAPNPNLSLKEWAARGVLGGMGRVLSFPFRLVGVLFEGIAKGVVKVVTWSLILVLLPTMLMLGGRLEEHMKHQQSIQAGASEVMHDGRHAFSGLRQGATDDLPPEQKAQDPNAKDADGADDAPRVRHHHRHHAG